MHSIIFDSKKFLSDLDRILSALITSTERRNLIRHEIITALINSEIDDGYSEFDNLLNVDPCENVNTSLNSIQDAHFKNSLKIELFKSCINREHISFEENIYAYKMAVETMHEEEIL